MSSFMASSQGLGLPRAPVRIDRARVAAGALLLVLAILPMAAHLLGESYYLVFLTRVFVFALAAVGLNLLLGFGGLVSLGHALYVGLGAYVVAVMTSHGITSGAAHIAGVLVLGAAAAGVLGAIALRTSGIAFIMITLAFAQMTYFAAVSLRQYGGDEGLSMPSRSAVWGVPLSDLALCYTAFSVLAGSIFVFSRLLRSPFGLVLRGCRSHPRRMRALGYPVVRYQWVAYVVSAVVCMLAGALLANLSRFASPSYMHWLVSGELIGMCVLGGLQTILGPVVGSAIWLLIEEVLTSVTLPLPMGAGAFVRDHWMMFLGAFLVVITLTMREGLYGRLIQVLRRA